MARKRDRIFAIFGAVLFFVSSFGFSIWVIWQVAHGSNGDTSKPSSTANTSTAETSKTKTSLAGTQLADFTPVESVDTLQTTDIKVGTGPEVKVTDTVTVDYVGAVAATGKIFQASSDSGQTATFPLDQVIAGWKNGIPGMKVGGVRRLLIPAAQAYAGTPPENSGIPKDAPLVFDVTLQSIGK